VRKASRSGRGGRGGKDHPGLGPGDAAAGCGEGGEEAGEVLAQVGAELVVCGGAVPDRVLLGAGQHRDPLGELGVGRQRPVRVHVGAQHVGQHDRVAVVGLASGDRVPVPVAGHCLRVDRVDLAVGGAQARDKQPARRLDRYRDRIIRVVAMPGQQARQRRQPGRVIADPAAGQQLPIAIDQGDVVMILGPVDAAEDVHDLSFLASRSLIAVLFVLVRAVQGTRAA
jgi:hypothetical protein